MQYPALYTGDGDRRLLGSTVADALERWQARGGRHVATGGGFRVTEVPLMSLLSPFAGPDPDHPRCWRCLMPLHMCVCASKSMALDIIGILHPRLATMRNAVQSGAYADDTGDLTLRRLEFLRWLVRHGKLGSE